MPDSPKFDEGAHIRAVFDKLLKAGWIDGFGVNADGGYALKWTAKGREMQRLVNLLEDELQPGPAGMMALLVICRLHRR
jgi:hypothetical protein